MSAAGTVSMVDSRSAWAASTRRRASAPAAARSRDSPSALASSRSRVWTAWAIDAKVLKSTPISSARSVCCAAAKSPSRTRSAETVSRRSGSSRPRLAPASIEAHGEDAQRGDCRHADRGLELQRRRALLGQAVELALAVLEGHEQAVDGDKRLVALPNQQLGPRRVGHRGRRDVAPRRRPLAGGVLDLVEPLALLGVAHEAIEDGQRRAKAALAQAAAIGHAGRAAHEEGPVVGLHLDERAPHLPVRCAPLPRTGAGLRRCPGRPLLENTTSPMAISASAISNESEAKTRVLRVTGRSP